VADGYICGVGVELVLELLLCDGGGTEILEFPGEDVAVFEVLFFLEVGFEGGQVDAVGVVGVLECLANLLDYLGCVGTLEFAFSHGFMGYYIYIFDGLFLVWKLGRERHEMSFPRLFMIDLIGVIGNILSLTT
jgi:hypothetical protein